MIKKIFQWIRYELLKPLIKDTFIYTLQWQMRKYYHIIVNDKMGKGIFYDKCTISIIKSLPSNSVCVDVGANKGLILREMVKYHPTVNHIAIEPIPELAQKLKLKYPMSIVHNIALSDFEGECSFNYIESAPELSGLLNRRPLDGYSHKPTKLLIKTQTLDCLIPRDTAIALIKIDVEGAEYSVLKGGRELIKKWKPLVIFEFERLAGVEYRIDPDEVYNYICIELQLNITYLSSYRNNNPTPIDQDTFRSNYFDEREFYFIAYP